MKNSQKSFVNLPKISNSALEAIKRGVEEKHSVTNLELLGVNQRLINLLESIGVEDLRQLMQVKKETLLEIPNFGKKQLFILFEALSKYDTLKAEYYS